MEYFDKDTDHIKYLETLSGRFTYRSKILILIFTAVFAVSSFFTAKLNTYYPLFILSGVLVLSVLLAMHIPCSYSADETGFTIVSGFVSRYFSYTDVNSVAVENRACGHKRNGGTVYENILTVSTDKGIYRFRESCGCILKRSLRYLPDSDVVVGGHVELIRLTEFIRTRIG